MPAGTWSNPSVPSQGADAFAPVSARSDWSGKRVVVMGLGRFGGGIGAARWFARHDARVVVTDLADERSLGSSTAQLSSLNINYQLGGHDAGILDGCDLLVVSPAVHKERSGFFAEAVSRGTPWTTEINVFLERCPAFVIGVTGSAGKSTTAAMIHACLTAAGRAGQVHLGGNVGYSLLNDVDQMASGDMVVLELSSFQLADLPRIDRRLDAGVIVTLWPHHLDRHGTFESYVACKLNMIRGAKPGTAVIVGFEDPALLAMMEQAARPFGVEVVRAAKLPDDAFNLQVPGSHNQLNARCATALCRHVGLEDGVIQRALEAFRGLPHRLEFIGEYAGVRFYNDSKATSPRAAATGLRACEPPVIALAGGRVKDVELDELVAAVVDHAKAVICFGTAGETLQQAIGRTGELGSRIRVQRVDRLSEAVRAARDIARDGDTVLLSPGFDSFDEFDNYEHRGQAFISLVKGLFAGDV